MLREVLSTQLHAKPEDSLQALHSVAIQAAPGPKPSTIDYIKLMTPVSKVCSSPALSTPFPGGLNS